jgi:putative tryptophan/tyrosine transport system substrate-binding protein
MRRIGLAAVLVFALTLFLAPLAAEAQSAGKVYRIGCLSLNRIDPASPGILDGFVRGLRERGWVIGQNATFEFRDGGGRAERLNQGARELVALGVDVIVAWGSLDTRAAMQATERIPIVMGPNSGDPVVAGFVSSLARPGGDVTGVSPVTPELIAKRIELLREVRPRLTRIGVVWDLAAGPVDRMETVRPGFEAAARALSVRWHPMPVRAKDDFAPAFEAARRQGVEGLIFGPDTAFLRANLATISRLALIHRLPVAADRDIYAESGLLLAYGSDLNDLFARAAHHVDKILRGAMPAELPVEQPTKFKLVINLKTAKALGLTIPQSLLVRADQIIE